ncbi:hypothetical protein, partial [Escherichia coli]|uniref:hypothetical protein n=1 Tax=Escherichia coli TaxID=562 RepID=UPI00195F2384
ARLAGLPTSVLQKAAAKSREFEATYGKCRKVSSEANTANWVDEIMVMIQKLNNAVTNLSSQEKTICIGSLIELQGEARELLQRC